MRRSALSAAIAAAAGAVTLTTAVVAPAAAGAAPGGGDRPGAPTVRRVQLITGDTVAVSSVAGHAQTAVVARSRHGIAGQFNTYHVGGDEYVIPGAARRYVGRVLDPSLFDVTKLAKQNPTGRFAVSAALTAGTKPAVPGLTVTTRTATAESGYLTAAGARAFGAALAKQSVADGKAHRVPTSLFGGVTRIAATGVAASHPVTPAFQQYTLQIKVLDRSGHPADEAFVILTNVDDGRKFTNFLPVENGLAKVSVPAGHYSGITDYMAFTSTSLTDYIVPIEEYNVTGSGQSLVFDTRKATVAPAVHTPRRATVVDKSFEWDRITKHYSVGAGFEYDGGFAVRVAPTRTVTIGRLEWVTGWSLASSPTTGAGYTYDLSFDDSGRVPGNQTHTLTSAQLATVRARYYTDGRSRLAYFGRAAFYPFQFGYGGGLYPIATPVARTEYIYGDPTARFAAALIAAPTDDDPFQGFVFDGDRAYQSGTTQSVDWLRGPLAAGIQAQTPGERFYFCSACRDDTTMGLFFTPYVDTTPGHGGTFDLLNENQVAGTFRLYRNGTLIENEVNSAGDLVTVSPAAATYRAVVAVHRKIAGFHTSTDTTEDVTFRSSASSGPTAPPGWFCPNDAPCTVLPILSATVPLPTDGLSRLPVGATTVIFSVGYNQHATVSTIGAVTFATTTNGGASYHARPVTSLGHGKYRVTLANSASSVGHGVGIRITASDSAGGKLVETVQNAYLVKS
jgi:hypothetical protein